MLQRRDLISSKNINIFTDASVCYYIKSPDPTKSYTISCPGCAVVIDGNIVDYEDYIIPNSTNNEGEIAAVSLGVIKAIKWRYKYPDRQINLFSDSNICIQSLRNWSFGWMQRSRQGTFFGSSNKPVANQDYMKNIIDMILNYKLRINFFHQKGHVDTKAKINVCIKDFKTTNYGLDISPYFAIEISRYNEYVDKTTKRTLDRYIVDLNIKAKNIINVYRNNTYNKEYINNYKELVNTTKGESLI